LVVGNRCEGKYETASRGGGKEVLHFLTKELPSGWEDEGKNLELNFSGKKKRGLLRREERKTNLYSDCSKRGKLRPSE